MSINISIGIVIVTQNGKHHLERLLPSLVVQDISLAYKIVVVDNVSVDGTQDYVRTYKDVDLIELSQNQGFAGPNNKGIEFLFSRYPTIEKIVFLNNDTIVHSSFLATLVSGFAGDASIGSVQTKIVSLENPEIIDSVGILIDKSISAINKGQGEKDNGQYDTPCEIFGTTGSAMMVSRQALETINLGHHNYFDHLYFAYQEDVDMAWRLRLCGFTSKYIPGEPVHHVHSATGKSHSGFKSFHIQRNTLFTLCKVLPWSMVFRAFSLFIGRYFSHIKSVKRGQGAAFKLSKNISLYGMIWLVIRAWTSFLWNFPHLMIHRWKVQKKSRVSKSTIESWFSRFPANIQKMIYDA